MADKYVKTVAELADAIGIARPNMHGWKKKSGFPEPTKQGWNVRLVGEFIRSEKEKQQAGVSGPNQDLKREKLRLECATLEEKLNQLKWLSIPLEEYHAELAELAQIVISVYDQDVDDVANLIKDAKLLKRFEARRVAVRMELAERITAAEGKEKES